MDLSIIIVNYNVKYFLEQCLLSLQKAIENLKTEIIIVDNNSSDGSKQFFYNKFPTVKFIWNNKNYGFAKANNIAVKHSQGKYILFLNPDTILAEDTLIKCIKFFKDHEDTGVLGIRMVDGSGKFLKESKRSYPDPVSSFYKLSGVSTIFSSSKIFDRYYLGYLDNDKTSEVDVLAGAFMMIPRTVLNECGLFDEQFFMYGEDIDLSYRIQKAGYKNIYFAETTIIHFKGESTKRGTLNYVNLFYKAMHIFVSKHYKNTPSLLYTYLIKMAILIRAIFAILFRCVKSFLNLFPQGAPARNSNENFLIVNTNQDDIEFIEEHLQKTGLSKAMNVMVSFDDTNDKLAYKINEITNANNFGNILFCEGGLSFKSIIEFIQIFKTSMNIYMYSSGSSSIISSTNKHTRGIITPLKRIPVKF